MGEPLSALRRTSSGSARSKRHSQPDARGPAVHLDDLLVVLVSGDVTLVDGRGAAWACDRAALRRFWKRVAPLRKFLGESPE